VLAIIGVGICCTMCLGFKYALVGSPRMSYQKFYKSLRGIDKSPRFVRCIPG